jgi:hypothetical protein
MAWSDSESRYERITALAAAAVVPARAARSSDDEIVKPSSEGGSPGTPISNTSTPHCR